MKIERIVTRQGHPVPETAHQPKGPFPPELFESSPIITEYTPQPNGGTDVPIGATSQNSFAHVRLFRCKVCQSIVREPEVDAHNCED